MSRVAAIFLILLCASAPLRADYITGTYFVDFEVSTDGTVITPTLMDSSDVRVTDIGDWSTWTGSTSAEEVEEALSFIKIENDSHRELYTPVRIGTTTYQGNGTRGIRVTPVAENDNEAIRFTFDSGSRPPSLSVGFFFKFNGAQVNSAPRDLMLFQDTGGNYQALQIYDTNPYYHAHGSGFSLGADFNFARDTWYWVTILRGANGGTMRVDFWNTTNWASLGQSTGTVTAGTGNVWWFTFGMFKYSYASQSYDFDNLVFNTDGVYPLGPGGGPLIPETRRPAFTPNVIGVTGGIQARSTIYDTLDPGENIQTAINNCPIGQVVKLNAGTHNITNLSITKGITLRGSGTNTLLVYGNGGNGISIESGVLTGGDTSINLGTGYTKGSTNVTIVSSSANLATNFIVLFDQTNDNSFLVFDTGNNGMRTDTSRNSGTRVRAQAVKVLTITSGTNLTFWPPLTYHFTNTMDPEIYWRHSSSTTNNYVEWAGIEDLVITNASSSAGVNIYLNRSANCWLTNVWSQNSWEWHVHGLNSYRNEIRNCIFDGVKTTANGEGYCISLDYQCCSWWIEDNIVAANRQFVQVNGGSTGNVVSYNYMTNAVANTNQAPAYTVKTGGHHNAHPMMNLFEGNAIYKFTGDFTWGSSSHNTVYRSWHRALMPYSGQSGTAFEMDEKANYYNIVGNIIGYSGITNQGGFTTWSAYKVKPTIMDYGNDYASLRVGYWASGDDGTDNSSLPNGTPQWTNYIVHANYDYVMGAQTFYFPTNTTNAELLVASFIHTNGTPAFFGSQTFPPFDPTTPSTANDTNLPAGLRWYQLQSGQGNPPTFVQAVPGTRGTRGGRR